MDDIELTILMPCLNEAETIGTCIRKAKEFLRVSGIKGEVLVADNGSMDDSVMIAIDGGARVIHVKEKGYGHALIAGCNSAKGRYVIMGDADDSYDFLNLNPFVDKLRDGYDLVMGNRFAGGIGKDAMPWLHKYIGNPLLSFIGRLFFSSEIKDFHCGLRGYNTEKIRNLHLHTGGMEYASEMVAMAQLNGLKITEVPTTLSKDGRSRSPHLRSFRDGWRHLKFLFMYAPNWLFLYPGVIMIVISLFVGVNLIIRQMQFGEIRFSIHTLLFFAAFLMIGIHTILFFLISKIYAVYHAYIPSKESNFISKFNEDILILLGVIVTVIGFIISIIAFVSWKSSGYSLLVPEHMMRLVIPGVTALEVGIMFIFSGFLIGIIKIGDIKK